ncbi:MAG: hypothetical protein QXG48_05695, partial [Thermofilaceae archaeon]
MKSTVREYHGRILVVVLLLIAMYFVARLERYYLLFIINILYFASIVLAWNIIGGYAGQLDLASAAYMATGGIVTALLIDNLNIPPLIAVFGGGLTSTALAGAIGFPMFRFGVKEVWYALSTAALVVILNNAIRLLIGPYEY